MPLPFTPISQLLPTPVPAKIKVRIVRLWKFEKADRPGQVTGINMILVDEQGTRIEATLGQGLLWKYQTQVEEGACRLFMNFKLLLNQGPFRGTAHPYKISIQYSSVIKEANEIPNLCHRFSFHPFTEILSDSHDPTVFFDIIGEIVAVSELEDVRVASRVEKTLRLKMKDHGPVFVSDIFLFLIFTVPVFKTNFLNSNDRDITIDLTLWSKFAIEAHSYLEANEERPVVLIGSLMKTRKFNGTTTVQSNPFGTKLFFSSEIEEIKKFKEGLGGNNAIVALSQISSGSFSGDTGEAAFPTNMYLTIADLLAETQTCVTVATIESFNPGDEWFYIACNGCFKKVDQHFNSKTEQIEKDKYGCRHCKNQITNTSVIYMIKLRASDETESAAFVMFDREVALLINKSAYELRQQQIDFGRETEYPQELLDLEGKAVLLKVKIKSADCGYSNTSYTVMKISVTRSQIDSFREMLIKNVPVDRNPAVISQPSEISAAISHHVT